LLADGEDPGSVVLARGAAEFEARLADSQPLSEYLIERLKSDTDLSSLDGQARLAELAKPLISAIPEGVFRDLLLERLAGEVGLSAARLGELLTGNTSRPKKRNSRPVPLPADDGRNTLIRRAVCLVLQQPSAAASLHIPAPLLELPNPGIALLTDLLAAAQENPASKPARLAEEFANHPDGGNHLAALLLKELHLEPDSNWNIELQETLAAILRQELEKRFGQLTRKAATGLSGAEKQEMRDLQQQIATLHSGGS